MDEIKKEFWELPEDLEKYHGEQEFKITCHIPKAAEIAKEAQRRGETLGRINQTLDILEAVAAHGLREAKKYGQTSIEAMTILQTCSQLTDALNFSLTALYQEKKRHDFIPQD